jgi:hypothetical protein
MRELVDLCPSSSQDSVSVHIVDPMLLDTATSPPMTRVSCNPCSTAMPPASHAPSVHQPTFEVIQFNVSHISPLPATATEGAPTVTIGVDETYVPPSTLCCDVPVLTGIAPAGHAALPGEDDTRFVTTSTGSSLGSMVVVPSLTACPPS